MTIEEAKAKIAELEPAEQAAWEALKAHEDLGKPLMNHWYELQQPIAALRAYVKFAESMNTPKEVA